MRFWLGLLAALALAAPATAQPVKAAHLTAELVSQSQGVAPGQTVYLAVRQSIEKGWHTYWRNPGDAGQPTQLAWSLPSGWRAGEIIWPAPHRLPVGPLMDYGYEGEVLLPVAVTAPADARPGSIAPIKVDASFLVCAETCVPADAALSLTLPITAAPAPRDARWGQAIDAALAAMPKPAGLSAVFQTKADGIALAVTGAALKGADVAGAYFYPYSARTLEHARPQAIERGPEGLTLTLPPGPDFKAAAAPQELSGVLVAGGRAFDLAARPGAPPPGASGLGAPPEPVKAAAGGSFGLAAAALLAFAGGLILNLMPCVFPVLAMKAASLAGHGREQMTARRQALAFAAGVLATFLALAGVLIALKTAGAAVGWGFQLQSPPIVAALALLMLAVALNLSGVFEVGTSLQGVGTGLAARQGIAGGVFTGALSVVVAAPCTAPFMGPALGWALTQPPLAALVVFLALAVGFALPFVAVAYAPGLLSRMPRPGPWMDGLRKALAFPMYGAAAWLVWVLTVQAGAAALARILAAAVAVALAAWLAGLAQRRRISGGRSLGLASATAAVAAAALALALVPPYATDGQQPSAAGGEEIAQPYSPARLAAIRASGAAAFVDYTAAWCVSCQVNERIALSTPRVVAAFREGGIAYLKADWTRRDAAIAADLARFGRAGVPLYVVYPAGGGAPVVLPAVLTEGAVLKALAAASAGGGRAAVTRPSDSSV